MGWYDRTQFIDCHWMLSFKTALCNFTKTLEGGKGVSLNPRKGFGFLCALLFNYMAHCVFAPWSSWLRLQILLLPFHLMKRYFSKGEDFWYPSSLTFPVVVWGEKKGKRKEDLVHQRGGGKGKGCVSNISPACLLLLSLSTWKKELYQWTLPQAEQR